MDIIKQNGKKPNMKIPFSPPDITEKEIQSVVEALRSGWITTGPRTKEFERQIAEYVGSDRCVCLNSQTACAEYALRIMGIGEGDEVITTAYTYTATASVICHVGATPILVDTLPNSLELDYDAVERAVTSRTKAIIPVDVGGIVCDYDRIFSIAEAKRSVFKPTGDVLSALGRIAVIADTAHSLGASRNGVKAGAIADFSAFSFHAVKNLTTAEGGALTWRKIDGVDSQDVYRRIQLLSLHGQSKDALAKIKPGAWEYDVIDTNYKCNMTDISAAMGLVQLERYPEMLAARQRITEFYNGRLIPLGVGVLPHFSDGRVSSCHLYITEVPGITAEQRNEIIVKMAERDIACNVHYKPLPMMTAYKKRGFDVVDYPNARRHFEREITLPLYSHMTDDEAEYVIDNYVAILKEYV